MSTLDIPTVDEVKEQIEDDVEYLETGDWIICEIDTEEHTTARQAHKLFGREKALEKVAKKIYKQKRREAKQKRREKRRNELREMHQELREKQRKMIERSNERFRSEIEDDQ